MNSQSLADVFLTRYVPPEVFEQSIKEQLHFKTSGHRVVLNKNTI